MMKGLEEEKVISIDRVVEEIGRLKKMSEFSPEDLVKFAENVGNFLANKARLKMSQIRKFLDTVNMIKSRGRGRKEASFFERESILLKPKLAYAAGKLKEVEHLMRVLDPCLDKVKDENDFLNLSRFLEAIVAYHKFYRGPE